ncbi:bacteriohemerythrin [Desulfohalovibrio reitneri]|uniref:bacteriohemerythrin n=1 Tax=Desulfohalovibrio reitneri TaxID=1307759 RepID=UPI00068CC63F|nr:hemerythrin family protein [Desulfohalovibrio reitneri]
MAEKALRIVSIDTGSFRRWAVETARILGDVEFLMPATGVAELDRDHRGFVRAVLDMEADFDGGEGSGKEAVDRFADALDKLARQAGEHFTREEALLSAAGSPKLAAHAREHQEFMDTLHRQAELFRNGRLNVARRLRGRLLSWWVDHAARVAAEDFSAAGSEARPAVGAQGARP